MSEAKTAGIFNLTAPAILLVSNLMEAKPFVKNGKQMGEPKFGSLLVFTADHPDLTGMKQAAAKVARARWADREFSALKFPFIVGEKYAEKRKAKGKNDSDWLQDHVLINSKSKYQPRLAYVDNGKIVDLETDTAKAMAKDRFYNGVEVLAQLNFVAYEKNDEDSKDGVTAYLNMILSTNKGKRRGGGANASEVFKGYVGGVSAEDPMGDDSLAGIL